MKNLIPLFVLFMLINPIGADDLKSQLDRDLQGVMTKVTDWRHHFHQYP
jgi:flagellar biosynthesis regulator FlbT